MNSIDENSQPISQWHLDKIHEISAQWPSSTPDRTVAQDLAYRHLAPQQQSGAPNTTTQIHFSIEKCRPTLESTELVCNGQEPESTPFDTDNSSSGKEISNMLVPMPFLVHQYTFSPCSDLVDTRQCSNDCSCPGCLTHNGDFSPLQPASPTQPTFVGCIDHGTGCACQPSLTTAARAQDLQRPFQSTTSQPHNTAGMHTAAVPSTATPKSGSGIIGDTICACPVSNKILTMMRAQAQVQVHAQLHGRKCGCRMGRRYFQTLSVAEAAAHQRPSPQAGGLSSASSWKQIVGIPRHLPG